jgi:hypothetical protein
MRQPRKPPSRDSRAESNNPPAQASRGIFIRMLGPVLQAFRGFVQWLNNYGPAWTTAAATIAIACLTVSLATDSSRQSTAIKGQLDEMRLAQRAWIGAGAPTFTNPSSSTEPLNVTLQYRNFGRQPASDFAFYYSTATPAISESALTDVTKLSFWKDKRSFTPEQTCDEAKKTPWRSITYPDPAAYTISVGPKKDTTFIVNGKDTPIENIISLITEKRVLYVIYGCFIYTTFGNVEHTNWCVMLDPLKDNGNDISRWGFSFCPSGNYPTEEKK